KMWTVLFAAEGARDCHGNDEGRHRIFFHSSYVLVRISIIPHKGCFHRSNSSLSGLTDAFAASDPPYQWPPLPISSRRPRTTRKRSLASSFRRVCADSGVHS